MEIEVRRQVSLLVRLASFIFLAHQITAVLRKRQGSRTSHPHGPIATTILSELVGFLVRVGYVKPLWLLIGRG
jgi:hypothetical protein